MTDERITAMIENKDYTILDRRTTRENGINIVLCKILDPSCPTPFVTWTENITCYWAPFMALGHYYVDLLSALDDFTNRQ